MDTAALREKVIDKIREVHDPEIPSTSGIWD
jgi:hypothetical protein